MVLTQSCSRDVANVQRQCHIIHLHAIQTFHKKLYPAWSYTNGTDLKVPDGPKQMKVVYNQRTQALHCNSSLFPPTCKEGYMVFLMRLAMEGRIRLCSSKVTMGNPSLTRRSNKDRSRSYPFLDSVCRH